MLPFNNIHSVLSSAFPGVQRDLTKDWGERFVRTMLHWTKLYWTMSIEQSSMVTGVVMFKIGELRRRLLPSFAFVRSFPHPATKRLISFGIITATNRSKKRFKETELFTSLVKTLTKSLTKILAKKLNLFSRTKTKSKNKVVIGTMSFL